MNIEPHEILIAAYHGRGLLSRMIRFRTWSDISHVAAINGYGQVIEAWHPGGVRFTATYHSGHKDGTRIDIYRTDMSQLQQTLFWQFCRNRVGAKYDFRGVFGFLSRRDRAHPEKWFCSELVQAASDYVGRPLLKRVPPHRVYPGMIVTSPRLTRLGHVTVDANHAILDADIYTLADSLVPCSDNQPTGD